MGSIELDPASCALANETVKAARYFTKDDDGLSKAWIADSLWLNPPYSIEGVARGMEFGNRPKSTMKLWIDKLIEEYQSSYVKQAILCTKADPKQVWFQPLWQGRFLICFTSKKIKFNRPDLPPEGMMFGTALVYLGPNEDRFIDNFKQFGAIARRIA